MGVPGLPQGEPLARASAAVAAVEVTVGLGASLLQAELWGTGSSQPPYLQRPALGKGDSLSGVQGLAPPGALREGYAPTLATDWACCDH